MCKRKQSLVYLWNYVTKRNIALKKIQIKQTVFNRILADDLQKVKYRDVAKTQRRL